MITAASSSIYELSRSGANSPIMAVAAPRIRLTIPAVGSVRGVTPSPSLSSAANSMGEMVTAIPYASAFPAGGLPPGRSGNWDSPPAPRPSAPPTG